MRNKAWILLLVLVFAAVMSGCGSKEEEKNENHTENSAWTKDTQYIVYFGLNDKTTGEQIVSKEEATKIILEIFEKEGVGYTVLDAFGAYLDEGEVVSNETVVLDILMVSEEELEKAVTEAVNTLHLASAMVTKSDVTYRFYTTEQGEK
ncbi:MAG: hypothetical protein Q4C48_05955 [Lachnospiraceae bacterium]|nr:hypothetical protein [Lachnospiraceae bacterium]